MNPSGDFGDAKHTWAAQKFLFQTNNFPSGPDLSHTLPFDRYHSLTISKADRFTVLLFLHIPTTMNRILMLVALLCATLFHDAHATLNGLRRLRNEDAAEAINSQYLNLAPEATGAELIQARRLKSQSREAEQYARELPANPDPEPAESMSLSMSLSMSMSMSLSMSMR